MLQVDYIFDTTCPWCYIGLKRLNRALSQKYDYSFKINYIPFILAPEIPPSGMDRQGWLNRKYGGDSRVERLHVNAAAMGLAEGIIFNFPAITRMPNSLLSHRLIRYVSGTDIADEVVQGIFQAYFQQGLDIGDAHVLAQIAARFGLDQNETIDYLLNDADQDAILADDGRVRRMGVNGIPCSVFDGKYAIAGAHEPQILIKLAQLAAQDSLIPALTPA